jgi:hypothetical protein
MDLVGRFLGPSFDFRELAGKAGSGADQRYRIRPDQSIAACAIVSYALVTQQN